MKIQITNKTDFETSHIRALIRETAKRFLPEQRYVWGLRILVTYRRHGSFLRGQGMLNGNWIRINLRRPIAGQPIPPQLNDPCRIAKTIWHEIQHNLGYRHRDIVDPDMSLFDYARNMPLAIQVVADRPSKNEIVQLKLAHAQSKVKQAKTRVKRAQSILKKWQRKVKYYSKAREQ